MADNKDNNVSTNTTSVKILNQTEKKEKKKKVLPSCTKSITDLT